MDGFLAVDAFTCDASGGFGVTCPGGVIADDVITQTSADAGNTGKFFIDTLDGASYTTASGHNYSPVPEPGALLLLTSGLAGFAGIAWRRRRK